MMSESEETMRESFRRKLDDTFEQGNNEARMKYFAMLMEENGWTYEQAVDACLGENRDPKYSLYYKMCDSRVAMSLSTKKGRARFAATLPDDEREIFLAEKFSWKKAAIKGVANAPAEAKQVMGDFRKQKGFRKMRKMAKDAAKEMEEEE